MNTVAVCETFRSIQGESTRAGAPCFFVRLAGCNLKCGYCDTPGSHLPGREVCIADLVAECQASGLKLLEITGGEPLMQEGFPELARELRDLPGRTVLVETNGSMDISLVPDGVIAIMDVKCPGSGVAQAMNTDNIRKLRSRDEVKFVLCDRDDYEWAKGFVSTHDLASRCSAVLFVPASGQLKPVVLTDWLIEDGLDVRLQLQLHRIIGVR